MNRLLDKLVITIICLISLGKSESFTAPVAVLLVSIGASAAAQLFAGRISAYFIIALSAVICGFMPLFFCALPLILYDALCEKKWWLVLPALTVFAHTEALSVAQFIISAAGIASSVIIYRRVSGLEQAVNKLTSLRDEMSEKNILLTRQNMRLAEAQDNEVRLATLKERNRIAREIHDNVGHMLTRSLLQSGALLIVNKDENLKEPLESLKNTLDSAMTSIRESVHDLHDDSVDLKKILDDSVNAVDERFAVSLDYDLSEDVPGKIKLCIAGIVKEGLSNAVKHSNGDSIRIVLREHPGFYQLMLEDNGKCSKINEGGIGLKNMEDRVSGVGGRISFTAAEKGFCIFMSVPK